MSASFIALIIGLLALDTTIAFQVLVAQPIFSCSLLGWILGDLSLGIEIGIMMQLLWINIVPVGGANFPEGNMASMITCAVAIRYNPPGYSNLVFVSAFLMGILVSYIGSRLTIINRKFNSHILQLTLQAVSHGNFRRILVLDIISVLVYFVMMFTLAYIAISGAGIIIPTLQKLIPSVFEQLFGFCKPAIWGIGISLTMQMIYQVWSKKKNKL